MAAPKKEKKNEEMSPELYQALRKIARSYFRGERKAHTLAPTALVHEAFIRWEREASAGTNAKIPLVAVMARLMRESLINYAKAKNRLKRGGGALHLSLEEEKMVGQQPESGAELELLSLEDALTKLRALDPNLARLVEVRYFVGLTLEETAKALNVSASTVKRDWAFARAWLKNEIKKNQKAA